MLWKPTPKPVPASAAVKPPSPTVLPCSALKLVLDRARQVQREPHILMLGELCGSNVNFLGERGYRVCVETDIRPKPEGTFGGALIWDAFALMPIAEARRRAVILRGAIAEGGAVLAIFGSTQVAASRVRTRYRILSEGSIRIETVEGLRAVPHAYQNRDIIRLFEGFDLQNLNTRRNGQREALLFKGKESRSEG